MRVMSSIIVAEDKFLVVVLVMVGVHYPGFSQPVINELAEMQFGLIVEDHYSTDEAAKLRAFVNTQVFDPPQSS